MNVHTILIIKLFILDFFVPSLSFFTASLLKKSYYMCNKAENFIIHVFLVDFSFIAAFMNIKI